MAASKWQIYHNAKKYITNGTIDLDTTTISMKLLDGTKAAVVSAYARDTFASLTHITTNLKTTVVKALTSVSVRLSSNSVMCFDAKAVVFTASGGTVTSVQYAVIGVTGGKALAWCKLSTAAFSVTSTLTVTPAAAGFFTISGGTTA